MGKKQTQKTRKTKIKVRKDDKRTSQLMKSRLAHERKKEQFPDHLEKIGSVSLGKQVIAARGRTMKSSQ